MTVYDLYASLEHQIEIGNGEKDVYLTDRGFVYELCVNMGDKQERIVIMENE